MIRVKGFTAFTMGGLEKLVNQWLAESGAKVVDIKHALSTSECTALVIYESTAATRWEE
ncbi:MAG: hypothetical protein FWE19_04185 [Oscillospiraceae bacterium]|nr:hypothetical protein [Oscillospiraceae bacterium]